MQPNHLRTATGIIAGILLSLGLVTMFRPDINPFLSGTFVRVGALMAVICLAFDELLALRRRLPAILTAVGLVILLIIATRPSLGRILIGVVTIVLIGSAALRWLSKMSQPR